MTLLNRFKGATCCGFKSSAFSDQYCEEFLATSRRMTKQSIPCYIGDDISLIIRQTAGAACRVKLGSSLASRPTMAMGMVVPGREHISPSR